MLGTLSMRLFVLIAIVTLAGLSLLAWKVVEMHTADLERETLNSALRLSDTLRRSTRSSMLKNRKEDVYQMMHMVGEQPGIERLRIFNKEGEITFSSLPDEESEVVDKQAEACTRCHTGAEPVSRPDRKELTRVFNSADGHRVLGLITPFYNEPDCSGPSCHASPEEQGVLGVLDLQLSLAGVDSAVEAQNNRFLVLVYLLMLIIASTCGIFVWKFVHRPVNELIRGTERFKSGELGYRIQLRSGTEIGELAASFNQMAEELGQAQQQLTDWAHTLEQRVEEKTRTLQQAQAKLVQSEKMASLGTLSAVVAHEINNPLSGVLTYAKLVDKMIGENGPAPERLAAIHKYLKSMERETARCGNIVEPQRHPRTNALPDRPQARAPGDPAGEGALARHPDHPLRRRADSAGAAGRPHQRGRGDACRWGDPGSYPTDDDRRRGGQLGPGGGPRHRRRDPGGHHAADLRAVLHDQTGEEGRGARPLGGVRHHQAARRAHRGPLPAR
jgi:two-component system NtrC family sensor kinase